PRATVCTSPSRRPRAPLPALSGVGRLGDRSNLEGGTRMSTLVAIAYPDTDTAERVRTELVQLTKEHLLSLDDAVVVEHRPDGKIKLHQAVSTTGAGAA